MSAPRPLGPDPGARRLARPDREDPFAPFLDLVAAHLRARAKREGGRIADEIDGVTSARPRRPARSRAPATAFLESALALSAPVTADLVGAVASLRGQLDWMRPDAAETGWEVAGRVAWAEIVGPRAPVPSDRFRLGLHLQAPRTHYPAHLHAADELYLTLAGEAWWARGALWAGTPDKAGSLRLHAPCEPHATETRPKPMLALYAWWGPGATPGLEAYRML